MLAIRIFIPNAFRNLNKKSRNFSLFGCRYIFNNPKHDAKSYDFLKNEVSSFKNVRSFADKSFPHLKMEEYNMAAKIIFNDVTQSGNKYLADVDKRITKIFDYNLSKHSKIISKIILDIHRNLSNDVTSEGVLSACILAWSMEVLFKSLFIDDDILDQHEIRSGELCLYKNPEVGLSAVNISKLFQCGTLRILKNHFGKSELYYKLLDEILKILEFTAYGRCMELLIKPNNCKPKIENFTIEKYETINHCRDFPLLIYVSLAMHLAGRNFEHDLETVKQLCLDMGMLIQIQNDYVDCYGKTEDDGKLLHNDIVEGRCSWLAVKFLENATDSLKNEWIENYGIKREECISKVKLCYEKVNLKDKYIVSTEQLHSKISSKITNEISSKPMQNALSCVLNTVYKIYE